jgi:UDP-3-O-[3-hydroxymyristoyl] glucosamine N-acyltransferase
MSDPVFFRRAGSLTIGEILELTGAKLLREADLSAEIEAVAPLDQGVPGTLVFLDNPKYADDVRTTRATACFVSQRYADRVPETTIALVIGEPYAACAKVSAKLFPDSMRPGSVFGGAGVSPGAYIHPEARLEPGVTVDPGAVIGHADPADSTLLNAQVDPCAAGIHRIFKQFLDNRCGALDHFAGGNLTDQQFGQCLDGPEGCQCARLGRRGQ